jgi:hypothetical protein
MLNPVYIDVLRIIYGRLNKTNINWVITGSLSFVLQGVPIEPDDIDIQTDEAGAYEIERCFSEFVTKRVTFSSTKRIRSHFGELRIDGVKVEIMGDVQKRLEDGTWDHQVVLGCYKRVIEVKGMQISVLSLEYEYQAYLKLGRIEKAEMLRKWLQERRDFLDDPPDKS